MVPDFLVIGHIVLDKVEEGYRLGGTAAYASLTARRLGLHAAVFTRTGPEVDVSVALPGVETLSLPSPCTTIFVNTYTPSGRVQHLLSVAPAIPMNGLSDEWRRAPIVLLGPLDQEVDEAAAGAFPGALVGLSPQGWMRRWDASKRVWPMEWVGGVALEYAQVMSLAEDDLPGRKLPQSWRSRPRILALTRGRDGSRLRCDGTWYDVPAYPAREVDPTGAGDVYAAAFLVRYRETGDAPGAALFASCVASFSVEAPGLEGIPTRAQVEERMARYPGLRAARRHG